MNLAQNFEQAQNAFQTGDLWTASRVCDDMIKHSPGHPDVLHLMALVSKRQGKIHDAEKNFRASLKSKPKQPAVLSNLGNLLKQNKRFTEADKAYERALRWMPGLTDAWYNRGLMAIDQGRWEKAIEYLEKAKSQGVSMNTELALISAHREAGHLEEAQTLADNLLQRFPSDVRAVAAVASTRRKSDPDAALDLLKNELDRTADPAAIHYELGLVHSNQKNLDEAINHFEAAVRERPEMIEAHRSLNEIYWQQEDDRFLKSYRDAIETNPTSPPLYHNLAAALISSEDNKGAEDVLIEALSRAGRQQHLVHGLAVQKLKKGELDTAEQLLFEALQADPDNRTFLIDCANIDIINERYERAEKHLDHALRIYPYNQELWAYKGIVWRLTGDERHEWLNDYDRLLKVYELPHPQEFENTQAFMAALEELLPTLHTATRQPLDQSVRNGTQTFEFLFDNPHPLIRSLKRAVEAMLADYLGSMPRDSKHPFYSRIRPATRFTGNWSIILRSGGYHTNHIHPFGWLSCCNYIATPKLKGKARRDRAGWIKFGETSLQLGKRENVAAAIEPKPGNLVFFPSYFWHGTYPFESEEPRMTVPCDIDPA
ncbi:MAG TPA: tetratricopeptide repeat protein [Xanthomonadales bacterium]|nr:tetratricopeptide repeat protein [Xanthomonadales bacterium]